MVRVCGADVVRLVLDELVDLVVVVVLLLGVVWLVLEVL
jgi:hypothetical protein